MPNRKIFSLLVLVIPLLWLSPALAWTGKVVSVSDGDTLKVLRNNQQVKIRLYGIDCPERKQAFGKKAKQFTSDMVAGRIVDVKEVTQDRYGRMVGIVKLEDEILNEELVRAGYAWVYKKYCDLTLSICASWPSLETQAREAKIGLWSDSKPIPPWDWRRNKRRN